MADNLQSLFAGIGPYLGNPVACADYLRQAGFIGSRMGNTDAYAFADAVHAYTPGYGAARMPDFYARAYAKAIDAGVTDWLAFQASDSNAARPYFYGFNDATLADAIGPILNNPAALWDFYAVRFANTAQQGIYTTFPAWPAFVLQVSPDAVEDAVLQGRYTAYPEQSPSYTPPPTPVYDLPPPDGYITVYGQMIGMGHPLDGNDWAITNQGWAPLNWAASNYGLDPSYVIYYVSYYAEPWSLVKVNSNAPQIQYTGTSYPNAPTLRIVSGSLAPPPSTPATGGAYNTTNADTGTMPGAVVNAPSITDAQIASFVTANISNPRLVVQTAIQYNVTVDDIARATDYSLADVRRYWNLGVAGVTTFDVNNPPWNQTGATPNTSGDVVYSGGGGGGGSSGNDGGTVTIPPASQSKIPLILGALSLWGLLKG